MNIKRFMKKHEASMTEQLCSEKSARSWNALREKHAQTIEYMQHERLIHLLVTLAFGLFLLLSIVMALIKPLPQMMVLSGLFFIMLVPYVIYYFFLENTVQRWYKLMDEIEKRAAAASD